MVRTGADRSNPFTPDWGVAPPVLVGRDEIIADAMAALQAGPRHPRFTQAFVGERGVGKTVLLDAVGAAAAARGWAVSHQAVRAGHFLEPLLTVGLPHVRLALGRRRPRPAPVEMTAQVDLGVVKASAARKARVDLSSLASRLEVALAEVGERGQRAGRGVLITLDEVHEGDQRVELPVLSQTIQLLTKRRALPVALLLAGLPHTVDVLSGPAMTFLERLPKVRIGFLDADATRLALTKPVADNGGRLLDDALGELTVASGGYPYLVQLLGFHAWEAAGGRTIGRAEARTAIERAAATMEANLFAPRWQRLAPKEQDYLAAVAQYGDVARTADVVRDLDAGSYGDVSYLRTRLLTKGMLRPVGRGLVGFTFPRMAPWVRRQRGERPS